MKNVLKRTKLKFWEIFTDFILFSQSRLACASQKASCRHPQLHCTPFLWWLIYYWSESCLQSDSLAILNRRFLIKSPGLAPPRPLKPEYCDGCFYMRRVPLTTRCQAGTRLLLPGFLPAWLDHHRFPLRKLKIPPQHCPSTARQLPDPPLWCGNTLACAKSWVRDVTPPFQQWVRCEPDHFEIAKFQFFLMNRIGGLMLSITMDRATGTPPQR